MKHSIKKILAATLAAAMVFTVAPAPVFAAGSKTEAVEPQKQSDAVVEESNAKGIESITANTTKSGKATLTEIEVTSKKSVTVPSKVTIDGVEYTVTKLGANAFEGETVKKVTLPKSITSLGAKAFSGVKGLKTIKINATKSVKVAKTAFKGVNTKNITITVNKKMSKKNYNKLVKALKAAGFEGKIKKA